MNLQINHEARGLIDIRAELREMTTEDLKLHLRELGEITARHVMRMALIWQELDSRGVDLSSLRSGIAQYLSAVSTGRLLPEAVVKLAGNTTALKAISQLTLNVQGTLLEAGSVRIRTIDGISEVPLHRLTKADVARAFDPINGVVIPPGEQKPGKRSPRAHRTREVIVMLTPNEHERLQHKAEKNKSSLSRLLYQLARDGGAFDV